MQKEDVFEDPIVTEVNTECPFYPAEIEHHDYYNQKYRTTALLSICNHSKN